ncbi:hypothetical protein ACC738_37550, partial [Rhizobium ruizarguesonis]
MSSRLSGAGCRKPQAACDGFTLCVFVRDQEPETTVSGQLPNDVLVSAGRAFAGLLVGGSIGFLLGIANGVSRISEQLTDTTLQMLRNIPHLAMIPL